MKDLFISKYCLIRENKIIVDNELVFSDSDADSIKSICKSAYRFLKPSYNKFFKMDEISKLAFIASEFLINHGTTTQLEEDCAIVLSNSHSTIITDDKHQSTVDDYSNFFPSPSVFVYTLPNIMIGEISIRHKLRGENAFFIVENFNAELIINHIKTLLLTDKSKSFIGGWVNQTEDHYEAFLYLAGEEGDIPHSPEELNRLYNKTH
jgi:hypothetical protein